MIGLYFLKLFEPHPSIRDPYLRFSLPKLSAYLFYNICISVIAIVSLWTSLDLYDLNLSWFPFQPHINLVIFSLLYFWSRSRATKWVAEITILHSISLSFLGLYMAPSEAVFVVTFMLVALLLSTMFLSLRATFGVYMITMVVLFIIQQQAQDENSDAFVVASAVYLFGGMVLLLQAWFQRSYEDFRVSELEKSELRYRTLLSEAYDGIITVYQNRVETIEPKLAKLLGFPAEKIVGKPISTILSEFEIDRIEPVGETVGLGHNDEQINFEYVMVEDHAGESNMLAIALRDVTEQRKTAEALAHAQRVDSMGMLASGIAHDFNNMLTGIKAHAYVAQMKLPQDSAAQKSLGKLVLTVDRASDLTRQLLAYAGKGSFEIKQFDFNQFAADFLKLLGSNLPPKVELNVSLTEQPLPVTGDTRQIQQVLLNLVVNAAQAIGEEAAGEIHVDTACVRVPSDMSQPPTMWDRSILPPGDYVRCRVSDTGRGMDEATMKRVFEPFYTTKESGTGLGLAATMSALTAHEGNLQLFSTVGEGTEFVIWLPLTAEEARIIRPN
ncbi:MAG: ATP-binding protein [Chloroflexota bacterium]